MLLTTTMLIKLTLFFVHFLKKAHLVTQRPFKVPIQYRDYLNNLPLELVNQVIFRQICSSLQEKDTLVQPIYLLLL